MAPRKLSFMLRQFKLAGAHPDVLWSIDATKAQHNGAEMARLETLLHEREKNGPSGMAHLPTQSFLFWFRQDGGGSSSTSLRQVTGQLNPSATATILHSQLATLFTAAGLPAEDCQEFEMGQEEVTMSVGSLLEYADKQQSAHMLDSGSLYIRSEKAIENLRQQGIVVVVTDGDYSYLVTLPESGFHHLVDNPGPARQQFATAAGRAPTPMKSIVGPQGEIHPDVQEYLLDRGLRPFELRMSGSPSAIEAFVRAFERLERMYEVHRGGAMRPGVCYVLRLEDPISSAAPHYLAKDGCLCLSMRHVERWEDFLLSRSQEEWRYAVEQHQQWRIGAAPKLGDQRRQLRKLADALGFFAVRLQVSMGALPRTAAPPASSSLALMDAEEVTNTLLREEPIIRKTVAKYRMDSPLLRKRGVLHIVPRLWSRHGIASSGAGGNESARHEIGYRLQGDGAVFVSWHRMKVPHILRLLRDNLKRIESYQKSYDQSTAALEHLSRVLPIDFSIDTQWKISEESEFSHRLETFVQTIRVHQREIGNLLASVSSANHNPQDKLRSQLEHEAGQRLKVGGPSSSTAHRALQRRYVWVVSDKLDALPTGVLFIPHNVDLHALKQCLLPGAASPTASFKKKRTK